MFSGFSSPLRTSTAARTRPPQVPSSRLPISRYDASSQEASASRPKEGRAMVDRFDLLMFAIAGYVAIVTLVRLMISRRDEVVGYLRTELERQAAEAAAAAEEDEEREAA